MIKTDKDKVLGVIKEISNAMTRIEGERDYIKEAIKTAVRLSRPEDIILVAGKGHEKYQEINGVKHPFDDKQVLQEMFDLLEK
mgnify:CR=1 FL=1